MDGSKIEITEPMKAVEPEKKPFKNAQIKMLLVYIGLVFLGDILQICDD
jgi:hypothetical protein